jgi:CBS domain-containing protein
MTKTTMISPIVRAADVMERDVISVTPDTRILDVHRLFVEEEIHGAPVVGDDGVIRGVISAMDLLRIVRDELEPGAGATSSAYFRDQLPYSSPDWQRPPEDFQDRLQDLTAADAMTKEIVMAPPDTPVAELAKTMLDQRIHRVLIGEDRVLEGVVTSFDLLRVLAARPARRATPAPRARAR